MRHPLLHALVIAAASGCGRAPPPSPTYVAEPSRAALSTTNGSNLNGSNLNGSDLNGSDLNGPNLSGLLVSVSYAGATRGATSVSSLHLEGTELVGTVGGSTQRGADLVGTSFVGNLGDGSTLALELDAVSHPDPPNADLDLYAVSYLASDGTRRPICADPSTGAPLYATAVAGRWNYAQGVAGGGAKIDDPSAFTFACDKAAIFKCVMWGYRPWTSVNGVSLAPYHQACTRLVRADYCGDGTPHTVNGSWINLYDNQGVQLDTESWIFEAQWSPDGATCLAPGGVADGGAAVSCYANLATSSCTADDPNAMLSSETPNGYRSP